MPIDLHTHYVPALLADALRARSEPPWIDRTADGGEVLHLPVGRLGKTERVDQVGRIAAIEHGDARHAAGRKRLGHAADLLQHVIQRQVARDHFEHAHLPLEQPGCLRRIRHETPLVVPAP